MTATTEPLTLQDYAATLEPDEEFVTELVRGRIVREPRPARLHGRVQVRLGHALDAWAEGHGKAEVTVESGYILSERPATVRGPDVAVVAVVMDPTPVGDEPGGWTRGAPDVAVEVLSPSDTSSAIQQKTLDYLEAGARLVWIVDPGALTVTVYRPDGSASLLRGDGVLSGGDVLPGFALELEWLFRS